MRSWQFAVVGLAFLAVAGCRTDPNMALLQRELRHQEDEIYRLRECIADYQAMLGSGPEEAVSAGPSAAAEEPPSRPLSSLPGGQLQQPAPPKINHGEAISPEEFLQRQKPRPPGPGPDSSEVPGVPEVPEVPQRLQGPTDLNLRVPLPPIEDSQDGVPAGEDVGPSAANRPAATGRAERLVFNRVLSGGYNTDARPGDEGLVVAVEPRDAQGRLVKASGELTVVVLDPALEGEAARVARWDFTAAETAARFRRTGSGRGIALEMQWPDGPPSHNDLHVFVRYTTADGRRLEVDGPIQIDLPERTARRWVATQRVARSQQADRSSEAVENAAAPRVRLPAGSAARPESTTSRRQRQTTTARLQRPAWSPRRQ